MPTNQQRRDAAKRKLERQLQRREAQDRARRQRLVIIGVVAAVLVISGGVWLFVSRDSGSDTASDAAIDGHRSVRTGRAGDPVLVPGLRHRGQGGQSADEPGAAELRHGRVHDRAERAGRPGQPEPRAGAVRGELVPVAGLAGLLRQHRLPPADGQRAAEHPAVRRPDRARATADPGTPSPPRSAADATYPVGTVALANAGANTNGSQFFIVYGATTAAARRTRFSARSPARA